MFEHKRGHIIDYSESTQKSQRSVRTNTITNARTSIKSRNNSIPENFGKGIKGGVSDRLSLMGCKKVKTSEKNKQSVSMNDNIRQNLVGRNDMLRANYSNKKYLPNDSRQYMESLSKNSINSKTSYKSDNRVHETPRDLIKPSSFISPYKIFKPVMDKNQPKSSRSNSCSVNKVDSSFHTTPPHNIQRQIYNNTSIKSSSTNNVDNNIWTSATYRSKPSEYGQNINQNNTLPVNSSSIISQIRNINNPNPVVNSSRLRSCNKAYTNTKRYENSSFEKSQNGFYYNNTAQKMSNKSSQNNIDQKDYNEYVLNTKSTVRNSFEAMQFFDYMKGNTLLTLKEINWNIATGNSQFSKSQPQVENSNNIQSEKSHENSFVVASNCKRRNCCEEIYRICQSDQNKKHLISEKKECDHLCITSDVSVFDKSRHPATNLEKEFNSCRNHIPQGNKLKDPKLDDGSLNTQNLFSVRKASYDLNNGQNISNKLQNNYMERIKEYNTALQIPYKKFAATNIKQETKIDYKNNFIEIDKSFATESLDQIHIVTDKYEKQETSKIMQEYAQLVNEFPTFRNFESKQQSEDVSINKIVHLPEYTNKEHGIITFKNTSESNIISTSNKNSKITDISTSNKNSKIIDISTSIKDSKIIEDSYQVTKAPVDNHVKTLLDKGISENQFTFNETQNDKMSKQFDFGTDIKSEICATNSIRKTDNDDLQLQLQSTAKKNFLSNDFIENSAKQNVSVNQNTVYENFKDTDDTVNFNNQQSSYTTVKKNDESETKSMKSKNSKFSLKSPNISINNMQKPILNYMIDNVKLLNDPSSYVGDQSYQVESNIKTDHFSGLEMSHYNKSVSIDFDKNFKRKSENFSLSNSYIKNDSRFNKTNKKLLTQQKSTQANFFEKDNTELKDNLNILNNEIELMIKERDYLHEKNFILKSQNEELNAKIEKKNTEVNDIVYQKDMQIEELKSQIDRFGKRITELGSLVDEKESINKKLYDMVDFLENLQKTKSCRTTCRGDVSELTILKNEFNIKQTECENEQITKQEEVLELKESTEKLMLKITEQDNILNEKNNEVNNYKSKINDFKGCLTNIEEDLLKTLEQRVMEIFTKNNKCPQTNNRFSSTSKCNQSLSYHIENDELNDLTNEMYNQRNEILDVVRSFSNKLRCEINTISDYHYTDNEISSIRFNLNSLCNNSAERLWTTSTEREKDYTRKLKDDMKINLDLVKRYHDTNDKSGNLPSIKETDSARQRNNDNCNLADIDFSQNDISDKSGQKHIEEIQNELDFDQKIGNLEEPPITPQLSGVYLSNNIVNNIFSSPNGKSSNRLRGKKLSFDLGLGCSPLKVNDSVGQNAGKSTDHSKEPSKKPKLFDANCSEINTQKSHKQENQTIKKNNKSVHNKNISFRKDKSLQNSASGEITSMNYEKIKENYKILMEKFNTVCDENVSIKQEIERIKTIPQDKPASKLSSDYHYSSSDNAFFNFKLSNLNVDSSSMIKNSGNKLKFHEEKHIASNPTDMSNYSSINKESFINNTIDKLPKPLQTEEAKNHLEDSNLKIIHTNDNFNEIKGLFEKEKKKSEHLENMIKTLEKHLLCNCLLKTKIDEVAVGLSDRNIKCTGVYSSISSNNEQECKKLYQMLFENFQIDCNGEITGHGSDQSGNFELKGIYKCENQSIQSEVCPDPIWIIKVYKNAKNTKPCVYNGRFCVNGSFSSSIQGNWWYTSSTDLLEEISADVSKIKKGSFEITNFCFKEWKGISLNFPNNSIMYNMKTHGDNSVDFNRLNTTDASTIGPSHLNMISPNNYTSHSQYKSKLQKETINNIYMFDNYIYGFGADEFGFYIIKGDLEFIPKKLEHSSFIMKDDSDNECTSAYMTFVKRYQVNDYSNNQNTIIYIGRINIDNKINSNKNFVYQIDKPEMSGFYYHVNSQEFGQFNSMYNKKEALYIKVEKRVKCNNIADLLKDKNGKNPKNVKIKNSSLIYNPNQELCNKFKDEKNNFEENSSRGAINNRYSLSLKRSGMVTNKNMVFTMASTPFNMKKNSLSNDKTPNNSNSVLMTSDIIAIRPTFNVAAPTNAVKKYTKCTKQNTSKDKSKPKSSTPLKNKENIEKCSKDNKILKEELDKINEHFKQENEKLQDQLNLTNKKYNNLTSNFECAVSKKNAEIVNLRGKLDQINEENVPVFKQELVEKVPIIKHGSVDKGQKKQISKHKNHIPNYTNEKENVKRNNSGNDNRHIDDHCKKKQFFGEKDNKSNQSNNKTMVNEQLKRKTINTSKNNNNFLSEHLNALQVLKNEFKEDIKKDQRDRGCRKITR